jgi:hypothetical protein
MPYPTYRLKQTPQDHSLAPARLLHRPYFSPKLGSWEVDVVYAPHPELRYDSKLYLFCVNINTKYLVVFPIDDRTGPTIRKALRRLHQDHFVSNIRGDGEVRGWEVSAYSSASPFDNHNRVVDRVIRTIRDAIGQNYHSFRNEEQVQTVVDIYNETPHIALKIGKAIFPPEEVQKNPGLEGVLIRQNQDKTKMVQDIQAEKGLHSYEKGNVLLVHLDLSRTPQRFMKKRRNYNALALFHSYYHGNVACQVISSMTISEEGKDPDDESIDYNLGKLIIVPIFYTKLIAKNVSLIPHRFKSYFGV